MNPLDISIGPIFWTIVNFLILLVVLRAAAWKPILGALRTREEAINDALDRAEVARAEAERILAENQKHLQKAEEEGQRVLRETREYSERLQAEAAEKAQAESRRMVEQANAEIQRSKQQALIELREEVATLAVEAAEKIIRGSLDADRHRRLVDEYLDSTTQPQN